MINTIAEATRNGRGRGWMTRSREGGRVIVVQ